MTAQILRFPSKEALHAYARGESVPEIAISGGEVRPHVQAFADEVKRRFPDVGVMGTYPGHDPSIDLALDIFPADKRQGDEMSAWAIEEIEHWAIDYVIWWQRIYNPEVAPYWRQMEDRGSPTQNHKDHNHYSFEPTGTAVPGQEDDMFTDDDRNLLHLVKALVGDCASGLAEWKTGKLPSPRLDAIEKRLDTLELAKLPEQVVITGGYLELENQAKK